MPALRYFAWLVSRTASACSFLRRSIGSDHAGAISMTF